MFAAMAESVAVRGYAATSVERVIEGAGVSRGTFYEQFSDRGDCLRATHAYTFDRLLAGIAEACSGGAKWEDRVAAAITAGVEFAVRFPDEARLLTLDVMAADGTAGRQGLAGVERLAAMLREQSTSRGAEAPQLSELIARALVGGVCSVVSGCLLKGESPAGLESQLIYLVLTPYVGTEEAARVAQLYS
jgi:AcrR family transcriptional regulator